MKEDTVSAPSRMSQSKNSPGACHGNQIGGWEGAKREVFHLKSSLSQNGKECWLMKCIMYV